MVLKDEQITNAVKEFLNLDYINTNTCPVQEVIKEMCVTKLCNILGINYAFNYKSKFFKMFSEIMGQAICDYLKFNIIIADDKFRLFKYNGINFIEKVKEVLQNSLQDSISLDETILDIFNFIDGLKDEI